jgi:hypothetical protein
LHQEEARSVAPLNLIEVNHNGDTALIWVQAPFELRAVGIDAVAAFP